MVARKEAETGRERQVPAIVTGGAPEKEERVREKGGSSHARFMAQEAVTGP